MQCHTRVTLLAVPVTPVALHLAERGGNLIGRRLDLLETEDVGTFPLDEFLELRLPRADTVDVPGRNLHGGEGSGDPGSRVLGSRVPGFQHACVIRRTGSFDPIEDGCDREPWNPDRTY